MLLLDEMGESGSRSSAGCGFPGSFRDTGGDKRWNLLFARTGLIALPSIETEVETSREGSSGPENTIIALAVELEPDDIFGRVHARAQGLKRAHLVREAKSKSCGIFKNRLGA